MRLSRRSVITVVLGLVEPAVLGNRERVLIIFKWLLVPASVLIVLGVIAFALADLHRMRGVRSIAVLVIVVACLLSLAAALMGWHERKRR